MICKTKSLPILIFQRLWEREKVIILLLILSLAIIIIKEYGSAFETQLFILRFVDCISNVQETINSIAISFLSGIIVYFLTIIIPEVRRARSLLVEIEQVFLNLETSFIDLAIELQLGDFEKPEECANRAVNLVTKFCDCKFEDGFYSLNLFRTHFESLGNSMNKLTEYLLGYSSVLSESEIDMIINIRQRKTSRRIAFLYGINNLLTIQEISDYFNDIAQLYKDICKLHENITKRIYKKKYYETL